MRRVAVVSILGLAVTACAFGPPPSCGEKIGGTADTARFDQYFRTMVLVSQTTGQPGPEGENGAELAREDALVIQVDARTEVSVRGCVQPRSGGGKIPFDQTQTLPQGRGAVSMGTFEPGSYVVRVIVDGILVKNLPFVTE